MGVLVEYDESVGEQLPLLGEIFGLVGKCLGDIGGNDGLLGE